MPKNIFVLTDPKQKLTLTRVSLALVALTVLGVAGSRLHSQGQPQNQAPRPARSRAEETLEAWNDIGNRLIAMAQDFPKTSTISKCRKSSAPLHKIFSTPPELTTSSCASLPDPISDPTLARTWKTRRVTFTRRKLTWSN